MTQNFIQDFYTKIGSSKPAKHEIINAYMEHLNSLTESEVSFLEMAKIVRAEQIKFRPKLTLQETAESINAVMKKRNVQFAFLMAIFNDLSAQNHLMFEPLQSIIFEDRGTFGGDEQIALEIANLYGTIGITNFGYLDREKQGFIKELDKLGKNNPNVTTTFIDDIFSAVISAAEARSAHKYDKKYNESPTPDFINISKINESPMPKNIEDYYHLITEDRFNNADPKSFISEFIKTQNNVSLAIRIQESAISYSTKKLTNGLSDWDAEGQGIKELVNEYASRLLNGEELSLENITSIMKSHRKNKVQRIDGLPDWEGDTIYALIPSGSELKTNTKQFDEVSKDFTLTIHGTTYTAHRLWWD